MRSIDELFDAINCEGAINCECTIDRERGGRLDDQKMVAAAAVQGILRWIDVLDFKEPSRGPLAPCTPTVWRSANDWARAVRSSAPSQRMHQPLLSAALGDGEPALAIAAEVPPGFEFAKAGPSESEPLTAFWRRFSGVLPSTVRAVAVAYADAASGSPADPAVVFPSLVGSAVRHALIDTRIKNGESLLQKIAWPVLDEHVEFCRRHHIKLSLAGSIGACQMTTLSKRYGDAVAMYGFRGAVCDGVRTGRLDAEKIRTLGQRLQTMHPPMKTV